jgi:hypothetical protein
MAPLQIAGFQKRVCKEDGTGDGQALAEGCGQGIEPRTGVLERVVQFGSELSCRSITQMEAASGLEPLLRVLRTLALTPWPRRHYPAK